MTITTLNLEPPPPQDPGTWRQRLSGWVKTGSDPRHSQAQELKPALPAWRNTWINAWNRPAGTDLPADFKDGDGRKHCFLERIR